jgi:hypothetical protein
MTLTAIMAVVVKMVSAAVDNSVATRAFFAVTTVLTQITMSVYAAVALFVTLLATLAVGATAIIFRLLTSRAALYLFVGIVIRNECTVVWWHIRNLFLLG